MTLFLGLIFILVDIPVTVGTAVIGLLPDFIGFFLIMKGLEAREDPWRHLAFGLVLAGVVLFVSDLVDKQTAARVGFWCFGAVAEILTLLLVYRTVRGHKRLRELFPVLVCIRMLALLCGWVPLVGTVCGAANAVVTVCFLAAAYKPLTAGKNPI